MIPLKAKPKLSRPKILSLAWRIVALVFVVQTGSAQLVREANTTLHFPLNVESTSGYFLTNAFPGLQFDRPVAIRTPLGETNRLYVVERAGRVLVITNLANPATVEVFLDIRDRVTASSWGNDPSEPESRRTEGLSSIAFHPAFTNNGRFFVTYNTKTNTSQGSGHHNRLSEFRADTNSLAALVESEQPIITQYDEGDGHNMNDAHFGPDGYLYVAIGDEGDAGTGDDYNNAQKIDKDFFSAILRIDVDKRAGSLPPNPHPAADTNLYAIPADNPYVNASTFLGKPVDSEKVRTEFFAVGFRNAWRMSFDPLTGEIYEGDVGQHAREEINHVVKGGNYGWSFKEGSLAGPKAPAPAGFRFEDPLWEYGTGFDKDWGFSVTGGVVSRGSVLPLLYGFYIYADFVSGNVWALNIDQSLSRPVWLAQEVGIAGFGYDPRNGEVLIVNHNAGRLMRIAVPSSTTVFPAKLSETGIFKNLAALTPETGIYPYDVNLPFWSDGAIKTRWFSLPDPAMKFQFRPEENWTLPTGATWIKHFELEARPGDPASRKRIETRVLVKTANHAYGVSYKWNDAGTDADLVPENGENKTFALGQGAQARVQNWRYPSRQECLLCHTAAGGIALGFNTAQLNKQVVHGSMANNQIAALAEAGFLANPPAGVQGLRALARPGDTNVSRLYRVKSYLAANCSFCHQPEGTARLNANWDGRITTPFSKADIYWGTLYNNMGNTDLKVVVPGRPEHSALIKRMEALDRFRMPPIGSTVIDQDAVNLLTEWVSQDTPKFETYTQWAARMFDSSIERTNTLADADPDGDGANNYSEYLSATRPLDAASKWAVSLVLTNAGAILSFAHPINRALVIESAPSAVSANWAPLQSPGNEMTFPAKSFVREVADRTNRVQQVYRARIIEP